MLNLSLVAFSKWTSDVESRDGRGKERGYIMMVGPLYESKGHVGERALNPSRPYTVYILQPSYLYSTVLSIYPAWPHVAPEVLLQVLF